MEDDAPIFSEAAATSLMGNPNVEYCQLGLC